jgi:DNA repair protein RecN (Recombination protein N)
MLNHLSIRDIVLIERLDIDLAAGLTVLTGETGAGKSIVLDAFALALGARGDAGLVRAGAEHGQVVAAFDVQPEHPARKALSANDLDHAGELILRRVQFADGRTRAFINDQPVSVQVLREVGTRLVEIHGQHDERALVDAATHRALLDAFAGLLDRVAELRGRWDAWRTSEAEEQAERERLARALADADYVRHAVAELTALAPQPGDEQALAERRATLMRAQKVAGDLREAHETVAGTASPVPLLSAALRKLERRGGEAGELVAGPAKALDEALRALDEARGSLEAGLALADFDPDELERIEERLFALRAAGRKYSAPVDELPAVAARFAADLEAIDRGEERLKALAAATLRAEGEYRGAAVALSNERKRAANRLEAAVAKELKPLRLERAEFIVDIESEAAAPGPEGFDRVEFWVRTNPGAKPGPMMKVASGGELSRFLLALKVVLAERSSAPTLVFDEVDSSVGGAVSDAIGSRLARLGQRLQVLSVTHAPQVAARAARHLHVEKVAVDKGKRAVTRVRALDAAARREEIARMLAGAEVTEEARKAAARLMQGAA